MNSSNNNNNNNEEEENINYVGEPTLGLDRVTFTAIFETMKKTISAELLNSISKETCFVCLLHLANEKSKHSLILSMAFLLFLKYFFIITICFPV